jgi:phenylpyruvate tautomerase PptA (4-oxalocrotonate tautomerase family)
MNFKLSDKEYKKLIIEIAKQISPVVIQRQQDNITAAEQVASLAKDITDAVSAVLEKQLKKDKK